MTTPDPLLEMIIRAGVLAADMELLDNPAPVSTVRNPDGSLQGETSAERTRRTVSAAIGYLVELGLLQVTDHAALVLEVPLPMRGGSEIDDPESAFPPHPAWCPRKDPHRIPGDCRPKKRASGGGGSL
jgi:hypothetical protein